MIDGDPVVDCRESGPTACSGACFERPGAFCMRAWRSNGDGGVRCGASHADCVAHRSIEYRAGRTESTSCVWSVPSQPSPLAAPVTTLFFCATNGQCFRSEGECYRENDGCRPRPSGWCLDEPNGTRRCFVSRAACGASAPSPTVASRCVARRRFIDDAPVSEPEPLPAPAREPTGTSEPSVTSETRRSTSATQLDRHHSERARAQQATLEAERRRREAERLRSRLQRERSQQLMMRRR